MRRILQVNDRRRALRLSKAELRRQANKGKAVIYGRTVTGKTGHLRALDALGMFADLAGDA